MVFIDYHSETGPCSLNTTEIKELLLLAVEKAKKRCKDLGHRNTPCELIFFKLLSTHADYVCAGKPVNIDPSNNHSIWFDELGTAW